MLPPRSSPPADGEGGEGEHDGYVNRHIVVQTVGWGGNLDSSFIVDRGMMYRYIVKYACEGESRFRDSQKLLTDMVNDASEKDTNERPSMPRMLQSAMMRCPTRRDMGGQEVQHLNCRRTALITIFLSPRQLSRKTQSNWWQGPEGGLESVKTSSPHTARG